MRITFALRFDDEAAAAEAADELRERGFEIADGVPVTAVYEVRDADELNDLRDGMAELADRLGGEFLGSGSFLRL